MSEQNINKTIVLCGMPASGKTTLGALIAEKLRRPFIDTDTLIEQEEKKPITQIFEENGEVYFREVEERIVLNALSQKGFVISLGGGSLENKQVKLSCFKSCFVVYLHTDLNVLVERLSGDTTRPRLFGGDLEKKLQDMYDRRRPHFEEVHLKLDVSSFDNLEDLVDWATDTIEKQVG